MKIRDKILLEIIGVSIINICVTILATSNTDVVSGAIAIYGATLGYLFKNGRKLNGNGGK